MEHSKTSQSVEQIFGYMTNETDTQTYYLVEGILKSKNKQKINNEPSNSNQSGGVYTFVDIVGAIEIFIDLLIDIFSKTIPAIQELMNLISNPARFMTDIIISKFRR
jgi:hypothetical protein